MACRPRRAGAFPILRTWRSRRTRGAPTCPRAIRCTPGVSCRTWSPPSGVVSFVVLFCEQPQPLDERPLVLEGFAGVLRIVLARPVPQLLVELVHYFMVLRVGERLLESVVQDLD